MAAAGRVAERPGAAAAMGRAHGEGAYDPSQGRIARCNVRARGDGQDAGPTEGTEECGATNRCVLTSAGQRAREIERYN